jgi:transposase
VLGRPARGGKPRGRSGETRSRFVTLNLSGPYKAVFDAMLPDAIQVADPFHVCKLANAKLDECRRRMHAASLSG